MRHQCTVLTLKLSTLVEREGGATRSSCRGNDKCSALRRWRELWGSQRVNKHTSLFFLTIGAHLATCLELSTYATPRWICGGGGGHTNTVCVSHDLTWSALTLERGVGRGFPLSSALARRWCRAANEGVLTPASNAPTLTPPIKHRLCWEAGMEGPPAHLTSLCRGDALILDQLPRFSDPLSSWRT